MPPTDDSMHQCTKSVTGIAALRSKWAAGKARRGSISESVRDRGATQPPAHFHRNPPGRASFGRLLCRSSVEDHSGYSPSSLRASSRNTRRRRHTSNELGALVRHCAAGAVFQDLVFVGSSWIQLGDHAIIGKHQNAIRDFQDFVDVAGDQDNRMRRLFSELLNQSVDVLASADIDSNGWLV